MDTDRNLKLASRSPVELWDARVLKAPLCPDHTRDRNVVEHHPEEKHGF